MKLRQNRNRQRNNMIKSRQTNIFGSHSRMKLFYDMKSNLYNVFILKCVSITNISIENYMNGVIR